jgi:formate dehydrogenase alpha subunit
VTQSPVAAPGTVALTVDGHAVEVPEGASLLDAVEAAAATLPHLCKADARGPLGACRTCLVEIEGWPRLAAACHTPAAEGMAVLTTSERAQTVRRGVLDLTIGMSGDGAGSGQAALTAREHGLDRSSYAPDGPDQTKDESNVFFSLNMADCILCGRCVDACQRTQHIGAIGVNGRGHDARIGVAFDAPWSESICTSCGQCVSECPTGALLPKAEAPATASERAELAAGVESEVVHTTCPYCGVGCGLAVNTVSGEIAWVDGEPENASSLGMTCVKGRFGLEFVHSEDRLTTPLVRRDGELEPASWDEALSLVAERFAAARRQPGKDPFATIASAKATNEDGYVLQKFTRAVMGTNSVDHCSRLCHAPSVVALMEQVGSGATSNSYEDYDNAGTLMVVGSDTSQNHPVVASRLRRAVEGGAKLVVVNPIRIDLAAVAEVFLQPRPGTDVALLNAMAHVILQEDLWDRSFVDARTEDFDHWRAAVDAATPEEAERVSGVPADDIRCAARLYARPHRNGSCLIWGMGVTQHSMGSDNARALVNLALLCGQVGKFGSGISPLRGQNNVQGSSDSGCLPNTFPGYEPLDGPANEKYSAAWGVELDPVPGQQSTRMIESMIDDELSTMYVVGENPLLSDPYLAHAREAFGRLDFLVVQDIFMHETAEVADVVLPAQSFAEKRGTFTNSERRVQLIRPIVDPPGEARADWDITNEIARRVSDLLERPSDGFEHESPSDIFDEMASLMPIIEGLSHDRLERDGGIQWPVPDTGHPGSPRLFDDEFPRGRGRFMPVVQGPPAAELPSRRFPFTLITGRSLYHWHGGAITRRVKGLVETVPVVSVDMHPEDVERLGFEHGQDVQLASRRGEIIAQVHAVHRMKRGELFVPFVQLGGVAVNFLTNDVLDAASGIPEYKACAVRVEAAGTPSRAGRQRGGQAAGQGPGGMRKQGQRGP